MVDIKDIIREYSASDYDFGFSSTFDAISEEEYNKAVSDSEQTIEDYKEKLRALEKLMIPFLMKLHSTADKAYIYWPDRKALIEKQIEKIVKLTRS